MGQPLRVLGMVKLEVHIGDQEKHQQSVSVVPDSYLNSNLLLGCDIISRSSLTWNYRNKVMIWGGAPYQVYQVS